VGSVVAADLRVVLAGNPILDGFIAEQPGNVTVYSRTAREFNTKAEQPGILRHNVAEQPGI
jgi:hypothetical protein